MKYVLLLLLLAGCASNRRIDVTVLSEDLRSAVPAWTREVKRRFTDARVVFCHGADIFDLYLAPSGNAPWMRAEQAAWILAEVEEGRPVVFVTCNNNGRVLHGPPNVFYSRAKVWQVPDADLPWDRNVWREAKYGAGCGSIWEFVRAEPFLRT
jgi:hypothetical protein